MIKGQVISGSFGSVIVRQKSESSIEIGELLIAECSNSKILMQAFDISYGSQISQQNLELISGMSLEENTSFELMEPKLRTYMLARLKALVTISDNKATVSKNLPPVFSYVHEIGNDDLSFLTKPANPLFLGNLRSGSKTLDVPVYMQSDKALSHHILVAGTTGRGKSVLISNLLWSLTGRSLCGFLVLDPHDEYYGRTRLGMKDHPKKEKVSYYTPSKPPVGEKTLKINIKLIKPYHFEGVIDFSDAQRQALYLYYKEFGNDWIESIILEKKPKNAQFKDDTLAVVRRRLVYILDLELKNSQLLTKGVFSLGSGESTISDICSELEDATTVIIDTSNFSGAVELLIGSLITNEAFSRYRRYKMSGSLNDRPLINIVLEEAPRVLGRDVLEKGGNIFSTIAREGRKFKVGLTAITQLPSLIPREILANMNTKIILGIEMKPERSAIIESASQDLSDDDRAIASLDTGEALVSSNFLKFATPVKIPMFEDIARAELGRKTQAKNSFTGISIK